MQSSSFSFSAEYTLTRAESRKLSSEELAALQAQIGQHAWLGAGLLLAGSACFAGILGIERLIGAKAGWFLALSIIACLLGLFTINSGFLLVLWAKELKRDHQRGQVQRFTLTGAVDEEGMALEILGHSTRIWQWKGGPTLPKYLTYGMPSVGSIRRASEVKVRHIDRTEFSEGRWRKLPQRLLVGALLAAAFLIAFGDLFFGDAFNSRLSALVPIPKAMLLPLLACLANVTQRVSLYGWWRAVAYQRDRAERIALCFYCEWAPEGSKYPPRLFRREVLLYSGQCWRRWIEPLPELASQLRAKPIS